MRRRCVLVALAASLVACAAPTVRPQPASADIVSIGCKIVGLGRTCSSTAHTGLHAAGELVRGHVGAAVGTVAGAGASLVSHAVFSALGSWAAAGAAAAVREVGKVMSHGTDPQLTSAWFSRTYWRVAGLAVILTLPFLFAAAIQAILRSDPLMLGRSAFGHLPLALLAVQIAAPVTMLLLAASDEMGGLVASATGNGADRFVDAFTLLAGTPTLLGSSFFGLVGAVLVVLCALALTLELLLREAAVYIVVLMLPLGFAAMVWPARRVWLGRSVELLIALILSKFVIVAVLALAFGALGQLGHDGVGTVLAGVTLLLLAVLSPWALMRLLPMAEVAAGMHGMLQGPGRTVKQAVEKAPRLESGLEEMIDRLRPNQTASAGDSAPATDDVRALLPAGDGGGADGEAGGDDGGGGPGDGGGGSGPGDDGPPAAGGEAAPAQDGPDPGVSSGGERAETGVAGAVVAGAGGDSFDSGPERPAAGGALAPAGGDARGGEVSSAGSPDAAGEPADERSPGLVAYFQQGDGALPHLALGPTDEQDALPPPHASHAAEANRPAPQTPAEGLL